ncbi:hypothetical protein G8759_20120 [Spirosoma aureum]|uniref:Phage tail tape measure protein n=1 Tax=Spirosoma aureum TaxID=2692134 RepID=A0A6G9AQZ8_9BACT|nr:hypothetical protein [Spirosoma aureum]QIP14759.1 hypothetical protein G8759_20120 [Spirosoma aureum]
MAKTQTERAVIDLVINGQQAKTTLKEVSLAVTKTRSELNKMKEADNPEAYRAKLAEMHKLVSAQRDMTARINDSTTAWGRFKKEMATVAVGVVGGNVITFALQQLAALIPGTIDRTMKLKDAFADIEKATGLSAEGVQKLNKELKNIDTRTSNKELRDIAVAGGQLGVANDELVDFVKNVDKAVVALGDEFTGGVDQVAKEIGGIAKLFDETRSQAIGTSINSIGSALNELGAAGAATSPVVAEFTTRMGQLGNLAPKLHETLGLGAALQELGLTAEIAASGLSGLMLTAANKSDLFAQHLGMSKKALEQLINTDPNKFLMMLAQSFQGLSSTQVAQRLKELKVESQESIKVMSLLADQTDFVAEKQQLANKAMIEGTSLTSEFDKKNHQLARDLKELNEWFNSLLTSEGLQNFLVSATHNAVEFIRVLPQVGKWLSSNKDLLYLLAAATVVYYGNLIKATAAAIANTTAELARKAAYEIGFRWLVISEAATKAYAFTTAVLTGQISLQTAAVTLARGAWSALSAIMLANPIGVIVAGMAALAYAVKLYSDNTETAIRLEREKVRLQRDMQVLTELQSKTLATLNEQLQDYTEMTSAERAEYVKNVAVARLDLESRLARMKAREKEMEMLAAEPTLWQQLWIAIKSGGDPAKMAQNVTQQVADNMRGVREQFAAGITAVEGQLKQYDSIFKQIERYEKPTKTGGGKLRTITDPEDAKSKTDKKKAEARRQEDELEGMLSDARERTMRGERSQYENEVAAFADKYSKMYTLAKDNEAKINEIRILSLAEWAEIEKRFYEKQDEDARKQQEKDNKIGFEAALNEADQTHSDTIGSIERTQAKAPAAIGDAEVQMQKLQADQVYLTQKLLLEQTFAQQSADTQRQLTENWNEQVKLRATTEHQYAEQMKQAEWALQDAKRAAMQQGLEVLMGFLGKGTIAYKAALIAQKAFAIAQVVVDLNREIAQIYANPAWSLMPDGGLAIKTVNATAAKVRAGISIASIVGTTIGELAAKADGGFTGMRELYPGAGGPSGFTNGPTLFNMGRRSYIAGEAGREFVISNRALQNPVVADFARMMDVAQRTGNYSQLMAEAQASTSATSAPSSSNSGSNDDLLMLLLQEQRLTRSSLEKKNSQNVALNYRLFEQYRDNLEEARIDNKL